MARLTFHIILHTHWDREWYLPRAAFQSRLVPVLGEVLDLLEREGGSRFVLDGQTIVAEDALDIRPDWIPRVATAVAEHRLETGPWYILADEVVPTGESLIRNLLQGSRDAAALGGRMDVLYSPDAFGHPAILPTLAAEFGIETGVVWRGLGRPAGTDRDFYRWRGPDGAEMLLYHLPAQGYEVGYDLVGNLGKRWTGIRAELLGRAVTSHIAVFVGADHHAPPADPAALRDAIHALESGNFVRISSLAEFFDAAQPEANAAPGLTGELRWSYGHTWTLQGTQATRARLKRDHGAVELYLVREVEPLAALAAWQNGPDQGGLLRAAWRTLLQCQFHDTIGGCCCDQVAREQQTRLASVHAIGREIARSARQAICRHDPDAAREDPARREPTMVLWNPVPRARAGIVTAEVTCFRRDVLVGPPSGRFPASGPGFVPFALVNHKGDRIPVQVLSVTPGLERVDASRHYPDQDEVDRVRVAFETPTIGGLGFVALTTSAGASPVPPTGLQASGRRIENRFVTIVIADDNRIEIIDRRSGERYVDALRFVDESDQGDSYTPWHPVGANASQAVPIGEPMALAGGPLVGALERRLMIRSAGDGTISARMILVLHADSPVVRVRLEIANHATDHRLRLALPVGAGGGATAGTAFGVEYREPVTATAALFPAEHPVHTAPAHRYVAAGAGDRGLALLCPGFFEYEFTAEHDLLLTLFRSVGQLSRADLPARPGHAGWPMATPDAQERGLHVIELAVVPLGEHEAHDVESLEQLWEDTFVAPQAAFVRDFAGDAGPLDSVGADLEGAGLIFTSVKAAESGSGLVLRCYNSESAPVEGRWVFKAPIAAAARVRADEMVIAPLPVLDGRTVPFTAHSRTLVSVMVQPGR